MKLTDCVAGGLPELLPTSLPHSCLHRRGGKKEEEAETPKGLLVKKAGRWVGPVIGLGLASTWVSALAPAPADPGLWLQGSILLTIPLTAS